MTFYNFVNVTQNIDDIAGKTNIKNVGILSLFESVIHANDWKSTDAIMAFPEFDDEHDHPIMRYQNGDFEFKFKCDECDSIDEDSCVCNDDESDGIIAPNNSEINEDEINDENDEQENWEDEPKLDNCTYCGDILRNHTYGNICGKHIPSYALWDHTPEDFDSNYSAFYEELSERKLAIELDEYDYGQDRSDIEDGYGYECEGEAESCY